MSKSRSKKSAKKTRGRRDPKAVIEKLVAKAAKIGFPLIAHLYCADPQCTPQGWDERITNEKTLREYLDCPVFTNCSRGKASNFTFRKCD